MDFTHKINHLSFGDLKDIKYIEVERIGKVDGKGKKSLISQKMYQEKFVRI